MRRGALSVTAALVLAGCLPKLEPPPKAAEKPVPVEAEQKGVLWQETFERPDIASLGWGSPSKSDEQELEAVFRIVTEGDDHFLRALHDGRPETDGPEPPHFGRVWEEGALKLGDACRLSWRWRVRQHPAAGEDPWLDLGASLYVIFELPGLFSGAKGFKLGWLQKPGPKGTKQRGIVQVPLRVDPGTGEWHEESVDLCALYREYYGDDVSQVPLLYVGVVTDADDTESVAEADYTDLALSKTP